MSDSKKSDPKKESGAKSTPKVDLNEIELEPDAWPRFERLMSAAAKIGPQPKTQKRPSKAQPKR